MDDNKFNADEFNEILRQRAEEERRKQPQNFQEEILPGISRQSAEAYKELGSGLGEAVAAPMLPVQAAVAKGVEGITGKEVKPEKKLKNLEAPTVSESLEALGVPESMLPPQYESPLGPMKYPPGFSPRELAGAAIETAGLEGALRGIPRLGKAIQASEKVQAELSAIPRIEPAAPNPKAQAVAERYMESRGQELKPVPKVTVNEDRARKIAQAYEDMPHNPDDPKVKRAYNALINETLEQFQHIKDSGLKISAIEPGQPNPYKNSKELMKDLRDNNHMWFFPTEQGFGPEGGTATSNHPLLVPTKEMYNGKPLLANDVFRIVHDYFGHVKPGVGFGPIGEENAWLNHMRMYSPEAQKALTTETRGQNSWVNYGPHGEHNRANPAQTIYGEQKAGLLPDWAMESEGHPPERLVHYSREDRALPRIDPKYMGTGAAGREAERIGRVPRSYYYKESATPESVVMGGAKSVHAIEHPGKIIDLQSPEAQPYISIAEKLSSNEEEATNKLEMLLKDAGYEGFENSESPVKGAVALFHPQTPIKSEPLGPKHFTTARARQAAELRSSQPISMPEVETKPSLRSRLKEVGEELLAPIKNRKGVAGESEVENLGYSGNISDDDYMDAIDHINYDKQRNFEPFLDQEKLESVGQEFVDPKIYLENPWFKKGELKGLSKSEIIEKANNFDSGKQIGKILELKKKGELNVPIVIDGELGDGWHRAQLAHGLGEKLPVEFFSSKPIGSDIEQQLGEKTTKLTGFEDPALEKAAERIRKKFLNKNNIEFNKELTEGSTGKKGFVGKHFVKVDDPTQIFSIMEEMGIKIPAGHTLAKQEQLYANAVHSVFPDKSEHFGKVSLIGDNAIVTDNLNLHPTIKSQFEKVMFLRENPIPKQEKTLNELAAINAILGNRDRHAGNWAIDKKGNIVLFDHGLSGENLGITEIVGNKMPMYLQVLPEEHLIDAKSLKAYLPESKRKKLIETLQKSGASKKAIADLNNRWDNLHMALDNVINTDSQMKSQFFWEKLFEEGEINHGVVEIPGGKTL